VQLAHWHISSEDHRLGDQIEEARELREFFVNIEVCQDDLGNVVDMERFMGITR